MSDADGWTPKASSNPAGAKTPVDDETMPSEQVAWAHLIHLAAHGTGLPAPSLDELGIGWVREVCDDLWLYRRADFEPSSFTLSMDVPLSKSQWRESCALAGSIAETLMLGAAATVEIMWHEKALRSGKEPAGMALGQRFFADAVVENTVAVAHRLINLVARIMRTDNGTQARMATHPNLKKLGPDYIPFETIDQDAWLPLTANKIGALRAVADPSATAIVSVLDRLDALVASPAWNDAFGHRAENFHRLRLEHPHVAGVDRYTGRATDMLDDEGNVVGRRVHSHATRYTVADGLDERVVEVARAAYEETARTAGDIITKVLEGLPELTGGFRIARTPTGFKAGYW
ncbi:hypothetical protein ACFWFQ_35580 [Nocardia salmonicida]|uniref:hypothetical protein n=1 Tax=Nocardia salmonicida TaxID=53431 RepID=UPI003663F682